MINISSLMKFKESVSIYSTIMIIMQVMFCVFRHYWYVHIQILMPNVDQFLYNMDAVLLENEHSSWWLNNN